MKIDCTYLRKVGDGQFLRTDPWKLHDLPVFAQLPLVPGAHSLLLRPSIGTIYWPTKTELPNSPDHIACVDRVRLGYSGLRIELAHNVQLVQALPRSRFDDEDQEFFAPSGIAGEDWGIVKFSIIHSAVEEHVECMLYIMGWANNHTQCSLVPCAKYAQAISDVHTDILASNLETKDLLRTLVKHDIPCQTMATIELHGTRRSAVVTLHKHGPPTCRKIEVGCRVWNDEEVPAMPRTSSIDWYFIDRESRLSLNKGPPIYSYP
jgi:hypothetical protein